MRDDTYHSRFCFICSNLCCVTTLLRLLKLVVYILIFSLVINDWGLVQFKSLILFFSPIFCFALVMWAQISLLRCVRIAIWRSSDHFMKEFKCEYSRQILFEALSVFLGDIYMIFSSKIFHESWAEYYWCCAMHGFFTYLTICFVWLFNVFFEKRKLRLRVNYLSKAFLWQEN